MSGALLRYRQGGDPFCGPTGARTAGNGSLMRLAPVVMFYHPDRERVLHCSGESSRTTHGAQECIDACRLFADMLARAFDGAAKPAILFSREALAVQSPALRAIADGAYRGKTAEEVRGTGYVVDCLEAALWCFLTTDSFAAAILQAANLGDDADTTAAVYGQLAGAHYGEAGFPAEWRSKLALLGTIEELADRLHDAARG